MKNIENMIKDMNEFLSGFKNMFNDLKTKGKRKKQIANLITLSRLGFACLIPPFALTGNLVWAGILTIVAATTDGIDGLVARKLDAVSEFGKNLDPVCDKLFAGILLIPLLTKISPLITLGIGLNLALEAGIAGVNLNSKAKGNVPRTSILGKVKTGLLSALMASIYVSFSYQAISMIIPAIYILTTATQALTLINYYQIDKKKDAKKKKLELFDDENNINSQDNIQEEKVKSIEDKRLTSEDYRNLREEVIRTYSKPIEKEINFQNIK